MTLASFTTAFEKAFEEQNLKIAVGALAGRGTPVKAKQLWAVCYGANGINIGFPNNTGSAGSTAYFAPKPLSNRLLSKTNTAIPVLNSDGTLSSDSQLSVSVSDIDLDAEMRVFLQAVDALFSPELMVPVTLINPGALSILSTAKAIIVENLLNYVTNLTSGVSLNPLTDQNPTTLAPLTEIGYAADKYRQECLIELSNFYKMDSVVVLSALSTNTPGHAVNMFGSPKPSVADAEFSLTTGKATLSSTGTPIAFGLFAKKIAHFDNYSATLEFELSGLEHSINTVDINGTPYRAGSWLKFVNTQENIPMGEVTIPIPLRSFPMPPHLAKQYAVDDAGAGSATANQNQLLEQVMSWRLNGGYSHQYAAQDTAYLDVQINTGAAQQAGHSGAGLNSPLLDALVAFREFYPQLQEIFNSNLLSGVRTPPKTPANEKILFNALNTFTMLVGNVAACDWSIDTSLAATSSFATVGIDEYASRYTVWEGTTQSQESPNDIWNAVVTLIPGAKDIGIVPQIRIPGYETIAAAGQAAGTRTYTFVDTDAKPLLAKDAWGIADRTVSVAPIDKGAGTPLNILLRQNGLLSMMIRRNAALPPAFHYQTSVVSYKSILSPLLSSTTVINIAGLGTTDGLPVNRTVSDHLLALFQQLLSVSGESGTASGSFQAVIDFCYPASAAFAGLKPISLPIVFWLPTPVTYGSPPTADPLPEYISRLGDSITSWLSENSIELGQLSGIWSQSTIAMDISLYSSLSKSDTPILRLRELQLPYRYILPK